MTVFAGLDDGAAGPADGVRAEVVSENSTFAGDSIQVRGLVDSGAVRADCVASVIGVSFAIQ